MIPRVAKRGGSFKGAALYYLHDKKALTTGRVAFTHTENLPTRDPDKAIKCMAWTAMNAQQIKVRAGEKLTGRKPEVPVYTYSLAWHPNQEPTQKQMLEAAKETLKRLKLDKHEALFVGHSDTDHPHIHVIVNLVNPKTGVMQQMPNDFHVLSRWAQEYERKWGKILCEQRVENNRRRDAGEYVKYDQHARAQAFTDWRRQRANEAFKRRKREAREQFKEQADELRKLSDDAKARLKNARAKVREEYRPDWRELYSRQRQEVANLKKLQQRAASKLKQATRGGDVDRTGERAVKQVISARNPQPVPGPLRPPKGRRASAREKAQARSSTGPSPEPKREGGLLHLEKQDRSGYLREAFELSTLWAVELAERHKKERAALSEEHRSKLGAELQKERNRIAAERDALKQKQKDEAKDLTKRHLGERAKEAEDKREGRDKKDFQDDIRRKRTAAFDLTREDIERVPSGLAGKFRRAKSRSKPGPEKDNVKDNARPDIAGEFNRARGEKRPEDSKGRGDSPEPFFKGNDSLKKMRRTCLTIKGANAAGSESRRGANRNRLVPTSTPLLVVLCLAGPFVLCRPLSARRLGRNLLDDDFIIGRDMSFATQIFQERGYLRNILRQDGHQLFVRRLFLILEPGVDVAPDLVNDTLYSPRVPGCSVSIVQDQHQSEEIFAGIFDQKEVQLLKHLHGDFRELVRPEVLELEGLLRLQRT